MTLDYYESGEDLGLSDDVLESFLLYQQKIKQQFIRMQKSYGIINLDLQKKIDQFLVQK
jgi:dTMP kinase